LIEEFVLKITTASLARKGVSRRQALIMGTSSLAGHGLLHAQEPSAMEKIKARGVLKVAVYKENAPYSDGPNADMRGLDVSLAKALASKLNLQLALLPFDSGENMNDDLRNMVWKGHYLGYGPADVMMHVPVDRYLMNENKQALIFGPYVREHLVVLHHPTKVSAVAAPDDLVGKSIAVEKGSGAASALMGYRGGLLRDKVSIFKDGVDAAKMVTAGKFDAAFVSRAQAESAVYEAGGQGGWMLSSISLPGVMPAGWSLGMAVKADNKELATALDHALSALRQSGELLKIFQSHGLTLAAP
jgi:ABC-type amino acid transport substrate-binding protein